MPRNDDEPIDVLKLEPDDEPTRIRDGGGEDCGS